MAVLLIFLSSVIASYWALTDPVRLRAMAQTYLSELVGGRVSVREASLSLLQGLRLSGVRVAAPAGPGDNADATIFSADAIDIEYDPGALLKGRLEATRIVATGPRVTLVESADAGGGWNFQRLHPHRTTSATRPGGGAGPLPLPQVVLRDAQVDYAELSGGRLVPRGSMDVEGRFFPSADAARYLFELQSRGAVQGVGPVVTGQVRLRGDTAGQVDATLAHFSFGRDVEAMLPREVRDFWQAHQLRGAVDIPEFRYTPGTRQRRATFRVRTRLSHVQLVVLARELDPPSPTATRPTTEAPPIAVDDVTGEFAFDQDGLRFDGVRGSLLGNTLAASGSLAGYSPAAAMWLRIETPADRPLNLPADVPYLASLPKAVRDVYGQLKPSGAGQLWVDISRPAGTGEPRIDGALTITDGAFDSVFFPYPVRHATGTVALGPDPVRGFTRVRMSGVKGFGVAGGPNAHKLIRLDGWVGPLTPEIGCGLTIAGDDIASEPPLFAAFAPEVREALRVFRGPAGEPTPSFRGDFVCHVDMPVGLGTKAVVTADLTAHDGSGRLAPFPYPVERLAGHIRVRPGYVDLDGVTARHGGATVTAGGRVSWTPGPGPADVRPDLTVSARDVPLDETLLGVLPPEAGRLARRGGVVGRLDVDGKITAGEGADAVGYDLAVAFHHGSARPMNGELTVTDLTADLTVRREGLTIRAVHGRRGEGTLSAHGTVDLPTGRPADTRLSGTFERLALDGPLRALLPPPARAAWDALGPSGAIDGDVSLHLADAPADYALTLRPRDVTVRPKAVPYQLDHVAGTVSVDPARIELAEVRGTHGAATVALSGHGRTEHPDRWDLSLSTRHLPVDADLRRALPAALRSAVERVKFAGDLDLDLTRLNYRGGADADAADVDVAGTARASGASLDVGVPIKQVGGAVTFAAAVRGGALAAVRGDLDLDTLSLADRPVQHLRAHLEQPAGSDTVKLTDVRGELAGGRLAGRIDLRFPGGATGGSTTAPTGGGYAVAFAVTDADVATIAGSAVPADKPIKGRLSASLDLQGDWSDPSTRRGRGDVLVAGRDMYQIPLVLGLLEVTDLSLPTSSPFNQATARYAVDGKRVTFEQLQMRGDGLVMTGAGWLDFGTKRVRLNFATDNPRTLRVPVVEDIWRGAKRELLQIQVRGTVQEPTVSAASMHTFTTTVDEVFSGGDRDR